MMYSDHTNQTTPEGLFVPHHDQIRCVARPRVGLLYLRQLLDVFRPQERIAIEYRGPNYERVCFFWGLFDIASGEKQTLIIEGPPGFCQAAVAYLMTSGPDLHIRDGRLLE